MEGPVPESATPGFRPVERDSRRLAACTLACEGIPTEELENGILYELIAACVHLRDDARVSEILNRLTLARCPEPRIVRRVEQLAAEHKARELSPEPAQPRREEPAPPPPLHSVSVPQPEPARTAAATRKFRLGMRVRVSARGIAELPSTTASHTGTVSGFSRSSEEVRIVRDGRTTPERFSIDFWEPDPDYRDVNESIAAGVRTPAGRGGEPLPVKRSPSVAWRRPPSSRDALRARHGACGPLRPAGYDGPITGA